ncbi:MAG: glycosyltransferase [Bryobacteraceae bacterium]
MPDQAVSPGAAIASEVGQLPEQALELSFDLYERYSVVAQVVRRLFPAVERLQILDVGANSPYLWPGFSSLLKTFLPEAQCTIVDVEITAGLRWAVVASGLELPFADNTFDFVCALDTLEHIPERYRKPFISELLRVSRDFVYLTFPYNSLENIWAERVVSTYLSDVLHSPVPQLKEHADFGLPHLSLLDEFIDSRNLAVTKFGHGNVDVWVFMMMASHTLRMHSLEMLRELNVRFNRDCAAFDWQGPTYRTSLMFSKLNSKSDLDRVISALGPDDRATLELSEVLHLIREFAEAEIAPQTLVDKDRHIQNLETQQALLRQAVEEKDQHIRNVETQQAVLRQAVEEKDQHIRNVETQQAVLRQAVKDKEQHSQNIEGTLRRALEDKDRHIVNLEAELAAVKRQAAITAELQFKIKKMEEAQQRLLEKQASLQAESNGLAQRLASSNQHVRDVVHELRVIEEHEHSSIRDAMQQAIRQQQIRQERIASRLAAQELLTTQLTTGRTWRTLQALGRVANQVIPIKRPESQGPPAVERKFDVPAAATVEQKLDVTAVPVIVDALVTTLEANDALETATSPTQDEPVTKSDDVLDAKELYFVCDEPSRDDKRPRNRTLVVRGWALGEESFDYIEVAIPGLAPQSIAIGTPRPDVKHNFPDLDKNGRSGFSGTIDVKTLSDGKHTAQIRLVRNDEVLREIETDFLIDHTVGYASDYEEWMAEFEAPADEVLQLKLARLEYRPLISIIMPVFNTKPDELAGAIDSVIAQSYSHWELCIADDGSTKPEIRIILSEFKTQCEKIKIIYLEKQSGIAAALNAALSLASGEYVALLDHDDTFSPHALGYVSEAINRHTEADLIYSDEDKLDERGARYQPFFKPDWSPDLILSTNYVCHLLVLRKALMDKVGEFCPETDGSQDYDYILRASKRARQIVHIPHVLYHWRAGPNSTASSVESKPYTIEASRRALERFCREMGHPARVEPADLPGAWRLRYPISEGNRVSIIIASGGNVEILRDNLESLFTRTEYRNFEVVVVDNSQDTHIQELLNEFATAGNTVRYIDWRQQPFNYSKINNVAARQCETPILLFLNDDVSVINNEWLTSMVELIGRPEVGAVGAKLLFPNGSIQHAGVVMGLFDNCGHAFYSMDGALPHYFGFTEMIRNVSAVTGACLMTKADVFWKAGGFDEERLAVAFNDVDVCLKIGASGYRVLFTPFAQLYHHESFSKTQKDLIPHPTEVAIMQSKWREVIASDPYYSPNLTRRKADYSLPTLWS